MVRWVTSLTGLDPQDAYQLVSQIGKLRVCNLVNPEYTALLSVPKTILPKGTVVMGG
jgi:acetamidase/formamidase